MADTAVVVAPGAGEQLSARDSNLMFKAVGATTDGAFSLHERRVPPGGRRPPAHVHPDRVEAFWVLEGQAEFELDGSTTRAGRAHSSSYPAESATRSARRELPRSV